MKVHPVAALFPMLAEDELKDLAEDIKANGLIHPIIVRDGMLIDGRNRLAACKLAGVEPVFEDLNGSDPVTYILSANINRRHLSKGQQAMVAARVVLETNTSKKSMARESGLNRTRISQASTVLEYAPDLVDAVIAGIPPWTLDKAYEEAQRRKSIKETGEEDLAELRKEAPDLARQVDEETLTLAEAIGANKERQRIQRERKRDALALITRITELAAPVGASETFAKEWADQIGEPIPPTIHERLEATVSTLRALITQLRRYK